MEDETSSKALIEPNGKHFSCTKGKYILIEGNISTLKETDHEQIEVWLGTVPVVRKKILEPHVIYDLLRSYERGINPDRRGLVDTLHYLRESFPNVELLLRSRFSYSNMGNSKMQQIVQESLQDESI